MREELMKRIAEVGITSPQLKRNKAKREGKMTESLKQPNYKKDVPTIATNSSVSPMVSKTDTEQEWKERIGIILKEMSTQAVLICPAILNTEYYYGLILAFIKEAGYVQLAEDQSPPHYGCANYMLLGDDGRKVWDNKIIEIKEVQQDMFKAGWRKVEL